MGTPPAPAWAIIFFAIKENQALPEWSNHVRFWKRFIDDGIGIWRHHPDPVEDARLWASFEACINDFHGLRWTFVEPCKSIDFMDLTMTIVNGKIEFTLFEKALNLYLYIPPKSALYTVESSESTSYAPMTVISRNASVFSSVAYAAADTVQ